MCLKSRKIVDTAIFTRFAFFKQTSKIAYYVLFGSQGEDYKYSMVNKGKGQIGEHFSIIYKVVRWVCAIPAEKDRILLCMLTNLM